MQYGDINNFTKFTMAALCQEFTVVFAANFHSWLNEK